MNMPAHKVIVYTTSYCGYCRAAKKLLAERGITFEEVDVTTDDEKRRWLVAQTGRQTVPQIFWDGEAIGGYMDLYARLPALLETKA